MVSDWTALEIVTVTWVFLAHFTPVYPQMISELQLEIPSYVYVQTVFFSPLAAESVWICITEK